MESENNLESIESQADDGANFSAMKIAGNSISIGCGNKICGSCKSVYPANPHIIDPGLCDNCGMGSYE